MNVDYECATESLDRALELVRTGDVKAATGKLVALGAADPEDPSQAWTNDAGFELLKGAGEAHECRLYVRFVTLAAEIYDICDLQSLVKQCLRSRSLQTSIDYALKLAADNDPIDYRLQEERWKLLRQQLYFWLQVARLAYREGDLPFASDQVHRCLTLVRAKLRPEPEGLLADLHFGLAAIARQTSKLDDAIALYGESLERTFERLKRKVKPSTSRSKTRGQDNAADVEFNAAKYLIGKASVPVGYCFLEKGMLREARIMLHASQMLLWDTGDELTQQYCKLLFARLLRHHAGRDPDRRNELEDARRLLTDCLEFSKKHRPRFKYRTFYEIGFVEMYEGNFAAAEKAFQKVRKAASDNDARWTANALVAIARLYFHRGEYADSLRFGREAKKKAQKACNDWSKARALVIQARAQIALSTDASVSESKRKTLRRAAERTLSRLPPLDNPAARALPTLLLCQLYQLERRTSDARKYFEVWRGIREQVQYQALQAFGRQLEELIYKSPPAFVDLTKLEDDQLNSRNLIIELERYIFKRLESTDLTTERKAKIWGGVRQAYIRRRKQVLRD